MDLYLQDVETHTFQPLSWPKHTRLPVVGDGIQIDRDTYVVLGVQFEFIAEHAPECHVKVTRIPYTTAPNGGRDAAAHAAGLKAARSVDAITNLRHASKEQS